MLFEKGLTVSDSPLVQASLYRKAWVNSSTLLDATFIKEPRRRLCHAPFALRKSFIKYTESLFPHVFQINSSHAFRNPQDFNLTNGFLQYVWLYQGLAEEGNLTNKMFSFYFDRNILEEEEQLDNLQNLPLDTFCIQDCMMDESNNSTAILKDFFINFYQHASPWEAFSIP